ncbi:MAG: hypothetical protein H6667_01430 [Ardenticatenaceae bacterium]|nr:hypothetical protein [Ardenticatenaceae bacterium]
MSVFRFFKPGFMVIGIGLMVLLGCRKAGPDTAVLLVTTTPMSTAVSQATATLIYCDEIDIMPTPGSRFSVFSLSQTCELENNEVHLDSYMSHSNSEIARLCQDESVQEIAVGEDEQTILIQRDYHYSYGCWTGVTTNIRSLRVCDKAGSSSTILAENIYGELVPSPDGEWFAFIATKWDLIYKPHVFRIRPDGTEMVQLDVRPFPFETVPGIQIIQWSADGTWLELTLWDGHENGYHHYQLRTDGSGEFEALP